MTRRLGMAGGLITLAMSLATAGPLAAQQPAPAPDNSKVNARDTKPPQKTAEDQSNKTSDVETTQKIRKAIIDDSTLSTYARNVKIITAKGKVTLKGPVRSDAEKAAIEAKAREVAGEANVTSQITIAPKSGDKKPAKKVGG
jgi:hyperosmotically inducible periplasmic protein